MNYIARDAKGEIVGEGNSLQAALDVLHIVSEEQFPDEIVVYYGRRIVGLFVFEYTHHQKGNGPPHKLVRKNSKKRRTSPEFVPQEKE
jgi:hypothetical protein